MQCGPKSLISPFSSQTASNFKIIDFQDVCFYNASMKKSYIVYILVIAACGVIAFKWDFFTSKSLSNPYNFGILPKENLSNEDYLQIQEILSAKQEELEQLVRKLYPAGDSGYATLDDFMGRSLRGVRQILIDPKQGWFPEVKLEKINAGGDRCIVTSVPYLNQYPELARSKTEQLRQVGFNGYYLYFVGGYPNPSGKEIQYVGVPYALKIFAMMEAQKRGFQKVLWLDSAAMPLRDPAPIFEWLEKKESFIHGWNAPPNFGMYVLPETRQLLKQLTGVDVLHSFYINSVIFGLKMDTKLTRDFIDSYFQMLQLGTPFLSCFPEECVFMAIYGQKKFKKNWKKHRLDNVLKYQEADVPDSAERIEAARSNGFFFYQLRH